LFVLSDGQPAAAMGPAHYSSYPGGYLEKCINKIETETDIKLFGFGFGGGESVKHYYKNSVYFNELNDEFLKALMEELKKCIETSIKK